MVALTSENVIDTNNYIRNWLIFIVVTDVSLLTGGNRELGALVKEVNLAIKDAKVTQKTTKKTGVVAGLVVGAILANLLVAALELELSSAKVIAVANSDRLSISAANKIGMDLGDQSSN